MKKIIIIFLLFIIHYSLFITHCKAQLPPHYYWRVIPSPVQANLHAYASDPFYSYIIGDNGTFLRSDSYGWTFSLVPGTKSVNLYGIKSSSYFNIITIVGHHGTIYKFTYNSSLLIPELSGTTADLFSISENRSQTTPPVFRRIAVGNGGTIIKSTWNVGTNWSSWSSIPSGTTQDLYSIEFYPTPSGIQNLNPVGCIAGNNGLILRTTDWGDSWVMINAGVTNKLNSFHFTDSLTCWITGSNGLLMKSTNRGLNWLTIPTGSNIDIKSFAISNTYNYPISTTTTLYYVCGSGGVILKSTNYGVNWINSQSPTQNNLNSITYSSLIVGNSGTILRNSADSAYSILKFLEGNNIKSTILGYGIIDQDTRSGNMAGFEWPKGSNKTAIFTAGLSIAGYYQGQLREAMASYKGEYYPGICNNGIAQASDTFKLYSVKREDGPANTDWLNWGLMVPYGAPFVDVNTNGIYEPQIDTPGVKNASQTIFLTYTDGFPGTHTSGEGYGGGTEPLYSEVHLTAWCYSQLSYADMQFLKYVVINKGTQPWTRTYFSIVSDQDLGWANDDYVGCDTSRNLGFCYNGTNNDQMYGTAPPAVGFLLLKGAYNKYSNPQIQYSMTSFNNFHGTSTGVPPCETDPNGEPLGAYHFIQGYKKDSTCWLDPTILVTPPNYYKKTKFIYYGDPETTIEWTELKGHIGNCNLDSSGQIIFPNPVGDRRTALNSGAANLTVMPGDTQTIVICQLIARGSNNLNSVTKLKQLADVAIQFYNSGYVIGINKVSSEVPSKFRLEQNYPNPFNPTTKIKFDIANSPLYKGGQGGCLHL